MFLLAISLLVLACSTTRVLKEGEYRLVENKITSDDKSFDVNQLSNYIRQDPGSNGIFGWNPLLYIYNFSKEDGFWHKMGSAPVVYDQSSVGLSLINMQNRLNYLGYYGSKVDSSTVRKGKELTVNYNVSLGKRYAIDTVIFDVPAYETFRSDFMSDSARIFRRLKGRFLSERILEEESNRQAARLRELGYYGMNSSRISFEADTLGSVVRLYYRIREYERGQSDENATPLCKFHIGKVSITHSGDLKFRESILRSLNTVHPGDVYSESAVNATYDRLSSIKAFGGVGIEMMPVDTSTVDCNINLTQSPSRGFKVNLEGSTNSSGLMAVSPQLSYFNKNIFYGGEWLNLGFNGDFQFSFKDDIRATEFGVTAGLSFPRFLGLPARFFQNGRIPRTELNLAFNYQNRPEYARNILSVGYGYTGTSRSGLSYQIFPLQVNFVRLFDIDSKFGQTLDANPFMRYSYQDHLDAGSGLVLYYNSSKDIIPRFSYYFHRFSVDLSGNILSLFKGGMETKFRVSINEGIIDLLNDELFGNVKTGSGV